ncbi:MAG: hypothetical protein ACE366_11750 [Bradymonadia bacterium]
MTEKPFKHLLFWLLLLSPALASALPLYTARGGRTCDNCHSLPNTWFDPPDWADRKCTMSCSGCHVDPGGGGMRTVSGRYYGNETLPMFAVDERPLVDRQRDMLDWLKGVERKAPASQPSSGAPTVATEQVDPRGPNTPTPLAGPAFGTPLYHQSSHMSWLEGRYGDLKADPLIAFGGDARLGAWLAGPLIFPMQGDLYTSVQPIEHLTLSASAGIRGRSRSIDLDGGGVDEQDRVGIRDLWVMTHEWPYLSYARVGRFLPIFGTRVADHTAYIRRPFGLSQEDPANRVVGAELGFTANYPYLHASVFKPSSAQARDPFATADGWGTAVSAGWRDLGWQIGASGMLRRRPLEGGGDTTDVSLQWGFNPWFYWKALPLTYLGEISAGRLQRPLSGKETTQTAAYHQLAWTAFNGIVIRGRYDFWDPDREVKEDHIHRPGLGFDLHPWTGLTFSADFRVGLPAGGNASGDLFLQLHGWF